MPELSPKSIPPAEPEPPSPAGPAASPPVIRPEEFEDYPAFRETFLLFFTDPGANATLRSFGRLLYEFVLEFWGMWPAHPEGIFQAELRAVAADLRQTQGTLAMWTGPVVTSESPDQARLARTGAEVAAALGTLAERLEAELGSPPKEG
jgi:hypothetical protein